MGSNNLYSMKQESDRKRLKRDLRAHNYNMPGSGEEGGSTYKRIIEYCDVSKIPYHLEAAANLNLIRHGEEVNEYQHRDGISDASMERIKIIYEREDRILWAGICLERDGKHIILSGYHRDTFCGQREIPFHFIVVKCTDRQAGVISPMSNSEAIDTPAGLSHSAKVKSAIQQATRIISEKGITPPLSTKQRTMIKDELCVDMKQSYETFTLDSYKKQLGAVLNEALDAFTRVEDATRLTLKNVFDTEGQKEEFLKSKYSNFFPDDPMTTDGAFNSNRIQLISISQWVNLIQRIHRYAYERETIGDEKVSKYGRVFSGNYKGGIHLAVGAYVQNGTLALTKKKIEAQRKEFLNNTKELNLNPDWFERDGRPKFERILFVSFFEGQDDVLYEWVNSKQDWVQA